MELLLLILFGAICFQAGKHWGYYKIATLLKQVAQEQGIDIERELGIIKAREEELTQPEKVYKLKVEQHGDMLYLFDKESDDFICQGNTIQELCDLAKKYKNVNLAAVLHGDKVFKFKDGTSIEVIA